MVAEQDNNIDRGDNIINYPLLRWLLRMFKLIYIVIHKYRVVAFVGCVAMLVRPVGVYESLAKLYEWPLLSFLQIENNVPWILWVFCVTVPISVIIEPFQKCYHNRCVRRRCYALRRVYEKLMVEYDKDPRSVILPVEIEAAFEAYKKLLPERYSNDNPSQIERHSH